MIHDTHARSCQCFHITPLIDILLWATKGTEEEDVRSNAGFTKFKKYAAKLFNGEENASVRPQDEDTAT